MSRFKIAIYGKLLPKTLEMPLGFSKMTVARVTCQNEQKTRKTKLIFHVWTGHHNLQI